MTIRTLRPHHLLDIVTAYKEADLTSPPPVTAPGENGVSLVTQALRSNLDQRVRFIVGPDDICQPCAKLRPDGTCSRSFPDRQPPVYFDEYNNPLDQRILQFLGMQPDQEMTLRDFLKLVSVKTPGLEQICTHQNQKQADRLAGLIRGLIILGIRPPAPAAKS